VRTTAGLAVVAFTAAACSTMPNDADPPDVHNDMAEPTDVAAIGRVDLQTTGNRVIDGRGSLGTAAPVIIDIGAEPEWIVAIEPIEPRPGMSSWLVVDEAGGLHRIDRIGEAATVSAIDGLVDPAAGPPLWADDRIVSSPDPRLDEFDTPLPDARIVTSADIGLTAVLTQPTDRYAHGVLGDDLEAAAVLVRDDVDVTIAFTEPDVAEAISPTSTLMANSTSSSPSRTPALAHASPPTESTARSSPNRSPSAAATGGAISSPWHPSDRAARSR